VSVIRGRSNKVIATVPVGTSPFGVTVSPWTGNVFVSNSGANTVQVIRGF
jgi:DNA-binding beta-propeller fold protein YncE